VPYISIVVAAPLSPSVEALLAPIAEVLVVESEQLRNGAIRRARGEFILSMSADLEFSDELLGLLTERRLEKGRLYLADLREGSVLHAREGSFPITAEGLRENAAEDIAAKDSGIHFGEGWFPAETDPETGEVFRWTGNNAEVIIGTRERGGVIAIELEAGPGVGPLPQLLQVLDGVGVRVAEFRIAGRATLQLWVPPGTRAFRLVAPDGGRPLLDDLRILNLRVFRCDWVCLYNSSPVYRGLMSLRPALTRLLRSGGIGGLAHTVRLLRAAGSDVFGPAIEYWGTGWHRLEESGTERFRWVSTDAELVVRIPEVAQDLCLLLEPGPSLNGRPFDLSIRLNAGKTIGKVRVDGLTLVRVPLPLAPSTVAALFLSPDQQGEPLPDDTRVLNFRVLACACEPSARPAPEFHAPAGWTSATVAEKPAGTRWEARLQTERRELAEIGKPAFLHVNACEFLLMDRERWFDLRGLPEADFPPEYMHVLFCYAAHFAGAVEEILHDPLLTRTPVARAGIDQDLVWLITQMRRLRTPAILSLDSWGVK
jgi:hypothetical protein